MSVAEDTGRSGFDRDYLEGGITRLREEDAELATPENEAAIKLAEEALEDLGE